MSEPYNLKVETDKIKYNIEDSFANGGNTINIEIVLPFSSLQTVRNIRHCNECPVGYMDHNCGRRIPLDHDCVPESCKLEKVSLSDILRYIADSIDIVNMTN